VKFCPTAVAAAAETDVDDAVNAFSRSRVSGSRNAST